jgi:site-specific DNA-methyltransferase (adenine-specific)
MIQLLQGNCIELLKNVEPDVMIVDPPYSQHVHESATSCGTPGSRPSSAAKGASKRDLGFDFLSGDLQWAICEMAARTRRWSVIFTDVESVGDWQYALTNAGATYIRSIPWVRWSMPQLSGDRPPQGHEMVVLAWGSQKGKKSWNGPGNLTHFSHTCMRGAGKHPAATPLDLLLDLVEYFSDGLVDHCEDGRKSLDQPGELIVDPCMGSGTTAMAAAALGRNFIGCEQDATWHEKARLRLEGGAAWYDDEERYQKYLLASAKRQEDMARMAKNTARIVANRKKQEADEQFSQSAWGPANVAEGSR